MFLIPFEGIEENVCQSREHLPVLRRQGRGRGEIVFGGKQIFCYSKALANEDCPQNYRFSMCCASSSVVKKQDKNWTLERKLTRQIAL